MLLISSKIKSVFKNVFFLIIAIEFILLAFNIYFYIASVQDLSVKLYKTRDNITMDYNNLLKSYLERKYTLVINDLVFIMQAYDSLQKNNFLKPDSSDRYNLINSNLDNCSIWGNDSSLFSEDYTNDWFSKDNNKTYIESRLKSTWIYKNFSNIESLSNENKQKLIDLCFLNRILNSTIVKHLRWTTKLPVTVSSIHFSFDNTFFVKYPIYYHDYSSHNWTIDCNNSEITDEYIYNPKCRPFYKQTNESKSNIVIVKPYEFISSGVIGSEICIKSNEKNKTNNNPMLVICIVINYDDFATHIEEISNSLQNNKKLFLIYNHYKTLNVMMSSYYEAKNYISYGKKLNINTEKNSLVEVYNKKLFDDFCLKKNCNFELDLTFTEIYNNVTNYYYENIDSNITKLIEKLNENNNKIERSVNDSSYYFKITNPYIFNEESNQIENSPYLIQDFYLLPIDLSYNCSDNYKIERNEKNQFDIYMLLIIERKGNYENVQTFKWVIIIESFLNFFFLTGVNLFIWVLFAMIHYYFSGGFFMPLNEINQLYKSIFLINSNKDFKHTNEGNDVQQQEDDKEKFSFKKYNFFEIILTRWIYKLFELDEFKEIKDCICTLKILKIIRYFDIVSTNKMLLNFELSKDSKLLNIVDALFCLMQNINPNYPDHLKIDYNTVINLLQNNFIYAINCQFNKNDIDVESFYNDINLMIEQMLSKKNNRRNSHLRISIFNKSETKYFDSEMSNPEMPTNININNNSKGNDNANEFKMLVSSLKLFKLAFINLKHALHYRYCIYKMRIIDSKIHGKEKPQEYIDYDYNSDIEHEELQNDMNNIIVNKNDEYYSDENDLNKKATKINFDDPYENKTNEDISNLVDDFNKYFSMSDESQISIDYIKNIAAHITQSGLLIEVNSNSEAIRQSIMAMEEMKNLMVKIQHKGALAKYAYLCISTLLFERVLLLFSNLSEKFNQKKTQFYLYLNMLDLGPVYDRKVRSIILQKLLDHLNKTGLDYIQKQKYTTYSQFFSEDGFVNTKLIRHKVRALLNMSKVFPKNILLLCDLNLIFLKEPSFQKIIKNNVLKNKHFFYFASFDQKLYIDRNIQIDEQQYLPNTEDKKENKNFFMNFNYEEQEIVNLFKKNEVVISQSSEKFAKTEEADFNNYGSFFNFIKTHKKIKNIFTQNLNPRVDISIKNAIKYHKFIEYPKNNNFIIVLTSIDAGFSFERENRVRISESLYENQYSLIVCIVFDSKIVTDEKFRNKLLCYKKFIESDIINGCVFLLKSFTFLKYVLNSVIPNKFKEFDYSTMKNLIESVNINFCDEEELNNNVEDF